MNLSREELLSQLREVDEYEFEQLVADIWEQKGWETEVTSNSRDRGVDIIAIKQNPNKERQLIQAKRYGSNTKLGSTDIQKYSGLYQRDEQVDDVIVVTSNEFTQEAKEVAKKRDVKTISGNEVAELLKKYELDKEIVTRAGSRDSSQPGYTQSKDWLIKCPFCDKKVHNSTESLVEHWALSDSCNFDKDDGGPVRVVDISWNKIVSKVNSKRITHKIERSGSQEPPMNCPFCNTNLERSTAAYIEHLASDDCGIDTINDIPKQRPTEIPPDIWWEIKERLGISGLYEEANQQNETKTNSRKSPADSSEQAINSKEQLTNRLIRFLRSVGIGLFSNH